MKLNGEGRKYYNAVHAASRLPICIQWALGFLRSESRHGCAIPGNLETCQAVSKEKKLQRQNPIITEVNEVEEYLPWYHPRKVKKLIQSTIKRISQTGK